VQLSLLKLKSRMGLDLLGLYETDTVDYLQIDFVLRLTPGSNDTIKFGEFTFKQDL